VTLLFPRSLERGFATTAAQFGTAVQFTAKSLVYTDKELGAVVAGSPIAMVIFVGDVCLMVAMVIPITRLVVRPCIMMIVGQRSPRRGPTHKRDCAQQ
jgi:hypothetical protein